MAKIDEIIKKYERKIQDDVQVEKNVTENFSKEFIQFKQDMLPAFSRYENLCSNFSLIPIKLAKSDEEKIQKQIDIAHLNVTPSQAVSFAAVSVFAMFILGILLSFVVYFYSGAFPFLLFFLFLIFSMFLFYYVYSIPFRLANSWRLKASSQMVPCVLYIVAYMKHTSNLERAISFAAQHLQPPLSFDFRKIFWDVETGKYSSVRESLDSYLEGWRDYSVEFIEAFHLIESSLYEPNEERRVQVLERALQVILDGVYEKMLKYSHEIRGPLTNMYMLGIVLPTLGLALLPLASTLLGGVMQWYHVFVVFNLIIPFFVFYMTNQIMLKRPGGYGEASLLEMNPLYPQYASNKPYFKAFLICLPLFLLGLVPLIFQYTAFPELFNLQKDYTFSQVGIGYLGENKLFDFKDNGAGPFGLVALILSLFIPLSIALFFGIAFRMKTKDIILEREHSKQLEAEFASSLFQLGNRLGDGMPAEMAFARIAESSRGLVTENFFKTVNTNMQGAGMSLEQAIFNQRRGAIIYYPSSLIAISMKILIESAKKGLNVAARSLMSISEYIKNIHKINERLRDLLAEIVSDMKSNMTFLAPLLSGIVVGLAGMIAMVLNKLSVMQAGVATEELGGALTNALDMFELSNMVPSYFLQISVGIYLVEIIFILTGTLVTVDVGEDKLKKTYDSGNNLLFGVGMYFIVALLSVLILSILAIVAIGGSLG